MTPNPTKRCGQLAPLNVVQVTPPAPHGKQGPAGELDPSNPERQARETDTYRLMARPVSICLTDFVGGAVGELELDSLLRAGSAAKSPEWREARDVWFICSLSTVEPEPSLLGETPRQTNRPTIVFLE